MKILLIILFMCFANMCMAQEELHLQGGPTRKYDVKRITIYEYTNSDTNSKPINISIHIFHNNREDSVYMINGPTQKIKLNYVDVYDTSSRLIGYNFYDDNGNIKARSVFKNDDKGRRTESESYYGNAMSMKEFDKYDDNGNRVEQDMYSVKGVLTEKIIHVYNDKGLEIEAYWNNPGETTPNMKYTFQYDDYDNQSQVMSYNRSGEVQLSGDFKYSGYDQYNNWRYKISANYMHIKNMSDISNNTITKRVIEY